MLEDFRLKVFGAVVRERSFTKAARSLGITQSAVSQSIAELEKSLSVQLFIRSRGAVELTLDGRNFAFYAGRIMNSYKEISELFPQRPSVKPFPVSLAVSSDFMPAVLPELLSPFVVKGNRFNVREFSWQDFSCEKECAGQGADLIICSKVSCGNDREEPYISDALSGIICQSPVYALVRPSVSLAYQGALSLESVTGLGLAVWEPLRILCTEADSKISLISSSAESIVSGLFKTESLAGILPLHCIYDRLIDRSLVRLPLLRPLGEVSVSIRVSESFSSTELFKALLHRLMFLLDYRLYAF